MCSLYDETVVSTTVTKTGGNTPQCFYKIAVNYPKECVTASNNRQTSIVPHVLPSLGRGNSLINSPTELQYLAMTLIFKIPARTRGNLSFNVF
jgi:hypothetical protein